MCPFGIGRADEGWRDGGPERGAAACRRLRDGDLAASIGCCSKEFVRDTTCASERIVAEDDVDAAVVELLLLLLMLERWIAMRCCCLRKFVVYLGSPHEDCHITGIGIRGRSAAVWQLREAKPRLEIQ